MNTRQPEFALKDFIGFSIEPGQGETLARVDLGAKHHNPNGIVHGAIPFALMDTAMGGAVMSTVAEGQLCATIEIHTRFHRPAAAGTLTATARVTSPGRRIVHLEAHTRDDDGRLIASATGSFMVFDQPPG